MKKSEGLVAGVASLLLVCAITCSGAVIVMDGSDGGTFTDWSRGASPFGPPASAFASTTPDTPLDGHSSANQIDVPSTVGSFGPSVDRIFGTGDLQGGTAVDWNTYGGGVEGITFDFYVAPGAPAPVNMNLYFSGGGALWFYNIPLDSLSGWQDDGTITSDNVEVGLAFNAGYPGGWQNIIPGGSTLANWEAAYGSVDEVGLDLQWANNTPASIYGIDNFALHDQFVVAGVPEPGTWMALSTALLSLGMTFRRRISDQLSALLKN